MAAVAKRFSATQWATPVAASTATAARTSAKRAASSGATAASHDGRPPLRRKTGTQELREVLAFKVAETLLASDEATWPKTLQSLARLIDGGMGMGKATLACVSLDGVVDHSQLQKLHALTAIRQAAVTKFKRTPHDFELFSSALRFGGEALCLGSGHTKLQLQSRVACAHVRRQLQDWVTSLGSEGHATLPRGLLAMPSSVSVAPPTPVGTELVIGALVTKGLLTVRGADEVAWHEQTQWMLGRSTAASSGDGCGRMSYDDAYIAAYGAYDGGTSTRAASTVPEPLVLTVERQLFSMLSARRRLPATTAALAAFLAPHCIVREAASATEVADMLVGMTCARLLRRSDLAQHTASSQPWKSCQHLLHQTRATPRLPTPEDTAAARTDIAAYLGACQAAQGTGCGPKTVKEIITRIHGLAVRVDRAGGPPAASIAREVADQHMVRVLPDGHSLQWEPRSAIKSMVDGKKEFVARYAATCFARICGGIGCDESSSRQQQKIRTGPWARR